MTADTDPRAAPAPIQQGGRLELRLVTSSEPTDVVSYDARVFVAELTHEGSASIFTDGTVEIDFPEPGPPAWLIDFTRQLLRSCFRHAQGSGSWPRRLTRWRQAPGAR